MKLTIVSSNSELASMEEASYLLHPLPGRFLWRCFRQCSPACVCFLVMSRILLDPWLNHHLCRYIRQASYYHRDPVELSYSISAGIAGVVAGPLLFVPLTSVFGRCSLVFWSLVCTLACNIWGPLMTGPNDYIPFVISRIMAGLFGSMPIVLASGYIIDLYFLHQRGKAFAVLEVSLQSGFLVTPALGGFIADSRPWPYCFWWLAAVNGFVALLGGFRMQT